MPGKGLSADQLERFNAEGYLVVEDVVDVDGLLEPMVRDYEARLNELASDLYAAGRISSTFADLPFGRRLTQIYVETGRDWAQFFDFSLPLRREIAEDEPCFFPDSVFNMLRNPGVLDVVESLIGSEIYSNPVQHVRLKPPERFVGDLDAARGLVLATPWHQDASVVVEEADETEIITVWIPVTDSTVENGCMRVVPKDHENGLYEHCKDGRITYLPSARFDVDRAIAVPMRRGSALFMNRMTPHSSLPNKSNEVRWSMDLRYNATGSPTGRPEFPGFVARSRRDPALEFNDPVAWRAAWLATRDKLCSVQDVFENFSRKWSGEGCA